MWLETHSGYRATKDALQVSYMLIPHPRELWLSGRRGNFRGNLLLKIRQLLFAPP